MGCTCCNSPNEHLYTRCLAFSVMPKCQYLPPATKLRRLCFYTWLSVILFKGGSTWAGTPGTRYTPLGRYTPRPGTPPGQVHPQAGTPSRPGTPQDQVHQHPRAGTPTLGRYTSQAGTPPWAGTPPRIRYTSPNQVHPRTRYTPTSRRLLLRTVRILLECILVAVNFNSQQQPQYELKYMNLFLKHIDVNTFNCCYSYKFSTQENTFLQ